MSQTQARTVPFESSGGSNGRTEKSIEFQLKAEFEQSSYPSLHCVTCRLNDGVLTLRGRVPSYYEKQLAQVLVHRRLNDTVVVRNHVEVIPTASPT
jgi:hypothetical protein